jgi:hypothetical protein
MATPPQTDKHAMPVDARTVDVLHDFVRDAVSHLSGAKNDTPLEFEYDSGLERRADGLFRESQRRNAVLGPRCSDLSALPNMNGVLSV